VGREEERDEKREGRQQISSTSSLRFFVPFRLCRFFDFWRHSQVGEPKADQVVSVVAISIWYD